MPVKPSPLMLTTTAVRAALQELEGVALPQRTLAQWVASGLVTPSVRASGRASDLWSLADLARVRLIMKLRRGHVSVVVARAIFAYLEQELAEVLKPNGNALLVVADARAYVQRPGEPDIEVPSGQLRLKLKLNSVFVGNEAAARRAAA